MTAVLAVIAGLLLLPVAIDLFRQPNLRRLGLRNMMRRPTEAALVTLGAMLATAIICSSFVVGDTVDASIRDVARTDLGPLDEVIRIDDAAKLPAVRAAVERTPLPDTDGITELRWSAAALSVRNRERAEPQAELVEMDFASARAFGADPAITGFAAAGPTPAPGEIVLSKPLAQELGITSGDRLTAYVYGAELELTVRTILGRIGLVGEKRAFIAPGTLAPLAAASANTNANADSQVVPPAAELLISNVGGIFDSAAPSKAIVEELKRRVGELDGLAVEPIKADSLKLAKVQGDGLASVFSGIGSFSVIAGVLLLVNLFVMLAEERKRELGMLRAVGLKRNHLLRAFGLEGACYTVTAALAGVAVGVGLGWVVVRLSFAIFLSGESLRFVFAVHGSSAVTAGLIGLIIGQLTVWLTSARIARLNVIAALRDLPDPNRRRNRRKVLVGSALGSVAVGALGALGLSEHQPVLALAGPAVASIALIPLLGRFLPAALATLFGAGGALAWGVLVFVVAEKTMNNIGIGVFVVQGVVLVTSAVMIVSAVGDRLPLRGVVARLGLAYPLARRVRTGLLLGMYALVVFTMVFLSAFKHVAASQTDRSITQMGAGFDLVVDSASSFPASAADYRAQPGVTAVASLVRGFPEFQSGSDTERTRWALTGFDNSLFSAGGLPELATRAAGFANDRAVFDALAADPTTIVVDEFFLGDGGGPGDKRIGAGDEVVAFTQDGSERRFRVLGTLAADHIFQGSYASASAVADVLGSDAIVSRHLVGLAAATSAESAKTHIQGALLGHGAVAKTMSEDADKQQSQDGAFFELMKGYLAVGLVIGIAGLGVVMVRAVRERRREIGMLRAMGFPAGTIRRAFLTEAIFVALQGIVIGSALGMLTAWSLLSFSKTFGNLELPFSVPWFDLAVLVTIPLVASAAAAALPAGRAAAIKPAVALRIA